MNQSNQEQGESLKKAVAESVQQEGDVRARVRDLTLQALKNRRFNAEQSKAVIQEVTEGIGMGLDKRAGEVKDALSEAVTGLDEALGKLAEATHLALRQLVSNSRDFTEHDLNRALTTLQRLEGDFLSTLGQAAEAAAHSASREMKDLVIHARRAGTDTGAKVAETMGEFGNRIGVTLEGGTVTGKDVAFEVSARLATLASGILAGLADALREKSAKAK